MNKLIAIFLLALSTLLSPGVALSQQQPNSYIVVGISGFGTRRPDKPWQPSGAHENLPLVSAVEKSYRLVHYSKKKEVDEVLENFRCRGGRQGSQDLGLVLVINSWGAGLGYKLASRYEKECGRKTDVVVLVDGVAKPIGAFSKRIPSKQCLNYYQTKGLVRGRSIEGCDNKNLTQECERFGYGPVQCHIYVEWEGTSRAQRLLEALL